MLKALELFGFKSFAERTWFEFPPGITAIVGPNGSGKSNVVDAIKWVLGEQSVKSLRGQEMADVIFNGSSTRRPMNAAEITVTLDNTSGILPIDTQEVHITRRFYRGGEGEYLLNRQVCRLRDLRDLLSGTGLGTSAYCVIEQGKVDILLQSSPRDRRVIFEEAAGISRYRLKKQEAQRRLERIEQSLLRLRDLVNELESRLKSLRAQAAKARRYQQYTDRLQQLRLVLAQVDWSAWNNRLRECREALERFRHQHSATSETLNSLESRFAHLEAALANQDERLNRLEADAAQVRERIAAIQSQLEHEFQMLREVDVRLGRLREQWLSTLVQVRLELVNHEEAEKRLLEAERHCQEAAEALERIKQADKLLEQQLQELRAQIEENRAKHLQGVQAIAQLEASCAAIRAQDESAIEAGNRLTLQLQELRARYEQIRQDLEQTEAQQSTEQSALNACTEAWQKAQEELAELRRRLSLHREQVNEARQHHAAAAERMAILEQWERSLEGVAPGTRQLLQIKETSPDGPLRHLVGLLVDLIRVEWEAASLIDLALGDRSQYLVAYPDPELLDFLASLSGELEGQAGILWLNDLPPWPPLRPINLYGQPGVIARVDSLVHTEAAFRPLLERLLGGIWVVDHLRRALELTRNLGTGISFVTLSGEWVGCDGVTTIGPRQAIRGLVSRRSELRHLRERIAQWQTELAEQMNLLESLQQEVHDRETALATLAAEQQRRVQNLAVLERKLAMLKQEQELLGTHERQLQEQLKSLAEQRIAWANELGRLENRRDEHEQVRRTLEETLQDLKRQQENLELQRQGVALQLRKYQDELAGRERELAGRRAQVAQRQQWADRARSDLNRVEADFRTHESRFRQLNQAILSTEMRLAAEYVVKEFLMSRLREERKTREELQAERRGLLAESQQIRQALRELEDQIHQWDLAAQQAFDQQQHVLVRLREDYGIELEMAQASLEEQTHTDRTTVEVEIEQLRRKIKTLGNVNLEALEELEQLESRYGHLANQYADLIKAKSALNRIIERINADSRQLFLETIQEVKGHFVSLFRSLFGGGHADILLEENVDPLESGVEIVARPPGKEPRSISLLSGGEKTLTCVALLLAIFRSRPSPFCVLDEVDAALDEANIDRFIKVLQDFPACTQFILVTHSKKTMTCANTIYGVTMQESGVSKLVSICFENMSTEVAALEGSPLGEELSSAESEQQIQAA